jgi:hypothetical protein
MKKLNLLLFVLLAIAALDSNAQSKVAEMIQDHQNDFISADISSPFSIVENRNDIIEESVLDEKTFLSLDNTFNKSVLERDDKILKLAVPIGNEIFNLSLVQVNIFSDGFKLYESSDRSTALYYTNRAYYWGTVDGDPNSLVAINIFKDEISGLISLDRKSYTVGKVKDQDLHIIYEEDNLNGLPVYECQTEDTGFVVKDTDTDNVDLSSMDANNCVNMYFEVDNDLYNTFGSTSATFNYVSGAFSQVAILYANESINVVLNELFIWNTNDPYSGNSTEDYLNAFKNNLNGNFNGDLAHLVGINTGGGIAYIDVLCNSNFGYGYSSIFDTYQSVPTYSWTVYVLTHEIGHNLGSPHSHNCSWNGNNTAIDGCGPAAGFSEGCDAPIPNSGGTIMSYCHLNSVGINFNNGFGPQPGDLIRNRVFNASCLTSCDDDDGCPNVGASCNDGDSCTVGDEIDADCNCVGNYVDADNDGFCIGEDSNDNDPCVPNNSGCDDGDGGSCSQVTVQINTDNYPGETTWQIKQGNTVLLSGGPYGQTNTLYSSNVCLEAGCYTFNIFDSYGDGICCGYGSGSYVVFDDNYVYASGGQFGTSEQVSFCVSDSGDPGCTQTGDPCNDGNICTVGETYNADCNCTGGIYTDSDNDGFCVGNDPNDNDPCIPDDSGCGGGGCTDLTVQINLDNYPGETTWQLKQGNNLLLSGGPYSQSGTTVSSSICLDDGCYTFTIFDSYGDGICCGYGNGSFAVFAGNNTYASGGQFGSSVTANFCFSGTGGTPSSNSLNTAEISIYPNPVSAIDELQIEADVNNVINTVELYNMNGQIIKSINSVVESNKMTVSLDGMGTGSYLVRVKALDQVITKKILIIE